MPDEYQVITSRLEHALIFPNHFPRPPAKRDAEMGFSHLGGNPKTEAGKKEPVLPPKNFPTRKGLPFSLGQNQSEEFVAGETGTFGESEHYLPGTVGTSRLRPLARRRFKTCRPSKVDIRLRKPWSRSRLIRDGWYVLFIGNYPFVKRNNIPLIRSKSS